jgi:hypothetical protein
MELPVNYDDCPVHLRRTVREEYCRIQDNKCCHCNAPLDGSPSSEVAALPINKSLFPESFFKWPVHLHHSHETGMTIGAVHNICNAVLWEYHNE